MTTVLTSAVSKVLCAVAFTLLKRAVEYLSHRDMFAAAAAAETPLRLARLDRRAVRARGERRGRERMVAVRRACGVDVK